MWDKSALILAATIDSPAKFTTLRRAVLAHSGEALASRKSFEAMSGRERDSLIEFLKSLQILPPGTQARIVDENFQPKKWPVENR